MFFFFNDTATTEIYTLSLHDALPISLAVGVAYALGRELFGRWSGLLGATILAASYTQVWWARHPSSEVTSQLFILADRKSTRLNSSHANISYAVFCLKKKKKSNYIQT